MEQRRTIALRQKKNQHFRTFSMFTYLTKFNKSLGNTHIKVINNSWSAMYLFKVLSFNNFKLPN